MSEPANFEGDRDTAELRVSGRLDVTAVGLNQIAGMLTTLIERDAG